MSGPRNKKAAEAAAALRTEIRRIWIARAQKYPFEIIDSAVIWALLGGPVSPTQATVKWHMGIIRGQSVIRRIKGSRAAHLSDGTAGTNSDASSAGCSAKSQETEVGR